MAQDLTLLKAAVDRENEQKKVINRQERGINL